MDPLVILAGVEEATQLVTQWVELWKKAQAGAMSDTDFDAAKTAMQAKVKANSDRIQAL